MPRHEHLEHGRHANRVGAPRPEGTQFRARRVTRATHRQVHAFAQLDVETPRRAPHELHVLRVVRIEHHREPGPHVVVVRADQRVLEREVDQVPLQHEVPSPPVRVEPATRVRNEQAFRSKVVHDANREGHLRCRHAVVRVQTTTHGDDRSAIERAEQQGAVVTRGGGGGEARNLLVTNLGVHLDRFGEWTESRPEHDRDLGRERTHGANGRHRVLAQSVLAYVASNVFHALHATRSRSVRPDESALLNAESATSHTLWDGTLVTMTHRSRTTMFTALLALVLLTLFAPTRAWAQAPDVQGPLQEVRVEGTDTYADIIRTLITAREGAPAERIDLEAERNRVYGLGTFATVTVSLLEERGNPVLLVSVTENPEIGEVVFEGVEVLDADRLRSIIASEHLLTPGRIFNTGRADDATATLAAVYRAEGFPFAPTVTLETEAAPELADRGERAPVRVRYVIDEEATIEEVRFGASDVLDEDVLEQAFRFVEDFGTFDLPRYRAAVREVGNRYTELGFRQSGVDPTATTLEGGVLDVQLRELRIDAIDTTPLGIDAAELTLAPGDLFNYDTLLEDVGRLATGRSGDVRLVPLVNASGGVRVTFELGAPDTAGEIEAIVFEGNTVLSDEALRALLAQQVGDTFTSTLAEEDFRRIGEAYADAGYVIAAQPDYNWIDGTYVQRIREYRIGAYRLTWQGEQESARPFVVLRRLPAEGSVLSLTAIDAGLRELLREGAVRPVDRLVLPPEGENDDVTVEVILEGAQTGLFQPAATYSTVDGFSATLSLSEGNLWGRAHTIEAELDARNADVGFLFGGSLRYSVPWLYLDVGDFKTTPTSISASVFSNLSTNQPLTIDGATRVTAPDSAGGEDNEVEIGEYTRRSTGFSVAAGRNLSDTVRVNLSARSNQSQITVEEPSNVCEIGEDGNVTDPDDCSLAYDDALEYAPIGGLSTFLGAGVNYDGRDAPEFPRTGVAASGSIGVGLGDDYEVEGERTAYVYVPVELGVKTYVTLPALTGGFVQDENHVLAARLNLGAQFGSGYPDAKRFSLGQTPNEATQVRGFRDEDFDLTRSYATASFEYRYDFNLTTLATQTLIAIAFTDVAWTGGATDTALVASGGVGLQLNLGFSGVNLPALRFDYGFSQRNPSGVFSFRIGTVF